MARVSAHAEPLRRLEPAQETALPPISLPQLDGPIVNLEDLRGTPVLVHFFATWCEPCKAEFATLARLAAQRPSIRILAVNVGEPATRVRAFARAERITLPILLDGDRKTTRAWRVNVLPTTFVLDQAHTARLTIAGDLDWAHDDTVAAIDAIAAGNP